MASKEKGREVRVKLEQWQYEALRHEAETRGTSLGDVIRELASVCALKYATSPDRAMWLQEQGRFLDKVFAGERSIRLFEGSEGKDAAG